jgi:hypothetical protein
MSTFKNMPAIVDLQRCVPDAVKSSILRNRNLGLVLGWEHQFKHWLSVNLSKHVSKAGDHKHLY